MYKDQQFKIYIIGNIPPEVNLATIEKFASAEAQLRKYNALIYNPIKNMLNPEIKREDAIKKNIHNLANVNAIYLLDEDDEFYRKCLELKLAFAFNLIIIHQPISTTNQSKLTIVN